MKHQNCLLWGPFYHSTSNFFAFLSFAGVVLKMARLIKDVSVRAQKAASDSVIKAPSKTFIIPSHELVQVVAKVDLICPLICILIFMFIKRRY